MLDRVQIEVYRDMPSSRPSALCLALQGGSVFADFDRDGDGLLYLVRISFDGYGCCTAPAEIGRLSELDSQAVLDPQVAEPILRAYFQRHRDVLWADALEEHGLL